MSYLQLAIAIFRFVTEFIKWLDRQDDVINVKTKVEKLVEFKSALREADQGKVENLEKLFTLNRSDSGTSVSDQKNGMDP